MKTIDNERMRIGIDVGGTKIEAIALDVSGKTLFRERVPTPKNDYQGTIDAIGNLVARAEHDTGTRGTVGIGIPGTISRGSGLVKNANSTCLIGHAFDRDTAERLDRQVRVANDADCFTVSEAMDGAAAGFRTVFGVILGTGVGGGLVVDGALLSGPNGISGEWGHNPLTGLDDPAPPPCYCGKVGCIETYLSGPGFSEDHFRHTGRKLNAHEIGNSAVLGDPEAAASLDRYSDRLARALAGVINIVDPDIIVLGGGLSNVTGLDTRTAALLQRNVFSDTVETVIRTPRHGDSSGVRGAAFLWPNGV